jgi:hypothetical protein
MSVSISFEIEKRKKKMSVSISFEIEKRKKKFKYDNFS